MAEQFIVIGGSLFFSFGAVYFCKLSSVYYDDLRCKAFIRIRSNLICCFLLRDLLRERTAV